MNLKYEYRPSNLKRRMECPASAFLEYNKPNTETAVSNEGTMIHEALYQGQCPETFNGAQSWIFDYCMNFYNATYKDCPVVLKEHKLDITNEDGTKLLEGTPDVIGIRENELYKYIIITDWKSGYLEVDDVPDNIQLAAYAVMAMKTFNINVVVCHIVQPRIKKIDQYTFTSSVSILEYIKTIIEKCEQTTLESIINNDSSIFCCPEKMESVCKYCRAKAECPKQQSTALATMEKLLPTIQTFTVDQALPQDLADCVRLNKQKAEQVRDWWKAINDKVREIAKENNGNCGDLLLTRKTGKSIIEDIPAVYKIIKEYISHEEWLKSIDISYSKLRDVFIKKQKQANKDSGLKMSQVEIQAKEHFDILIGEFVKKSEDTLTINIKEK